MPTPDKTWIKPELTLLTTSSESAVGTRSGPVEGQVGPMPDNYVYDPSIGG